MKVLMFSMERALLGEKTMGDAIERHKRYAEVKIGQKEIEELNIIVLSKKGYIAEQISTRVSVYPTNSATRFHYFLDAFQIGKKIFNDSPYDLVIGDLFTGLSAWLLKRKFKIKFLMHFHGDFWDNKLGLEGKWHNWFILIVSRFLAGRADGIRVVSTGVKKKLTKRGVDSKKIKVINTPTSINLIDCPDQAKIRDIQSKFDQQKIILFIGRLEKVKNIPLLIKVFKEIKREYQKCRLLIIGKGSQSEILHRISGGEEGIVFLGGLNVSEWKNYFSVASLLVLPSLSESFGNVLALAGAAGVPVVATKTTGAQDIVSDGKTGFLVPIQNEEKLKSSILKILQDEKLAKQMGQNAQKYCREKFDPEKTTQEVVKFWWEIVEEKL